MEAPSSQPLNLCYCYAYEDTRYLKELDKHLTTLKTQGMIQTWYDCELSPNGFWEQTVATHINTAHIVLLLISVHFISSEKCYHREMTYALERHHKREACVIPILLSDVDLVGTYLSELRMLPDNDRPITRSSNRAQIYTEVAKGIRQVVEDILATRNARSIKAEDSHHKLPAPSNPPSGLISSRNRQGGFLNIAWSPDASWLASGADDGTVRLCDVSGKSEVYTLHGHTGDVYSVAWSSDGQLASSSADCTVRLWDASDKRAGHILQGHAGTVNSVAWSPDGKRIASGSSDKTLRLWDASGGCGLHTLTGHTNKVMSVAWSPDGSRLASGSHDQTVRLWDASSGRELRALQGHETGVMSVAWSPDGSRLASGSRDQTVRLWDASSRRELHILRGHTSIVTAVAWSPNGNHLASGSNDRTVRLWDANLGRELRTLQGHTSGVIGVAWSPDGSLLATASHDELYVWRTDGWEQIAVLNDPQGFRVVIRPLDMAQRPDKRHNDEEIVLEEFLQQDRESQGHKLVEHRQTIICPSCGTTLPEKQMSNRRKRGLEYIICSKCNTSISLLASQEQPSESNNEAVSGLGQLASEERERRQSIQVILQRKIAARAFDVFLCHNGLDKPTVKHIGEQLKLHGILPWLDEWELRPGQPWQRLLEQQITQIKTAAVFVGQRGLVPWQRIEIDALLREFADRNCPIIPVLLPDAPTRPELPLFLKGMTWVDFRLQEPDPMQQLRWGITGKSSNLAQHNPLQPHP
jgi:WD40 repeat protein